MSLSFTYLLNRLHHGMWLEARSSLSERICRRPYCLQGWHALFNFTVDVYIMCGASAAEYSARNTRKITSVAENIFSYVSND